MSSLMEVLDDLDELGGWKEELMKKRDKIERVFKKVEGRGSCFYPNAEDVFRAFELTPLDQVKVVIWGQDPYPALLDKGVPRAQGYSFGVSRDDIVPKSLVNIYKEIKEEYPQFKIPRNGDLTHVAKQGVLFLNSALTYCPDEKKDKKYSHINIWVRFMQIVVEIINLKVHKCVHVFWGKKSEKMKGEVPEENILCAAHPSPMSAYRGFFGCNHFIKINIILDRLGKPQINWNQDPDLPPTFTRCVKLSEEEVVSNFKKWLEKIAESNRGRTALPSGKPKKKVANSSSEDSEDD